MKAVIISLLVFFIGALMKVYADEKIDESWLDDDSEWRALQVNEGQLTFIEPVGDKLVLHSDTHFWITEESLQTGWLRMQQCYKHLDAVGRTDVVYQYKEMQQLRIERTEKIAHSRVVDKRIEIEDVLSGAQLCASARVKILNKNGLGEYVLEVGPYHRKFLDGYYPYHVTMTVYYPSQMLKLVSISPGEQNGFRINRGSDSLSIDAWFEGRLNIKTVFQNR